MRCRSCNAQLSIEDEKCPYCGTPNPEALKHRQDMQRFSGEFTRTQSSVLRKSSETAQKSMRIVIICVMAVLVLLSFIFLSLSWDIGYAYNKWKAAANSEEYCEILDTYEAEGDYLAFAAFFQEKNLYGVDAYKPYYYVHDAANNYKSVFFQITTLLEEERWEGGHKDALEYLCDYLDDHYKLMNEEPFSFYEEAGAYDQRHLDAVRHIHEKIENLIQLTFSLSDEEMTEFEELSAAEKQVLLERRFFEHE